jgi:hypothetical protein
MKKRTPDQASQALAIAIKKMACRIENKTADQKPTAVKLYLMREPKGCWASCQKIRIAGGWGPGRVIDKTMREARKA